MRPDRRDMHALYPSSTHKLTSTRILSFLRVILKNLYLVRRIDSITHRSNQRRYATRRLR